MKHILSYGGGVNSTALYFVLKQKGLPIDEIIFADTGNEYPETYITIEKFKKVVEQNGDRFITVKSEIADSLYDYCWKRKTIPFRIRRDCTDKFKLRPIRKYLRGKYGKKETFTQYIGIAKEEAHRMKEADVKYLVNKFPLVWEGIDRKGCEKILKENGFNNVVKSGCYFCPYSKKKALLALIEDHPELYEKAVQLEENCKRKDVFISSIPLKKLREDTQAQRKIIDYPMCCDVSGGCFL